MHLSIKGKWSFKSKWLNKKRQETKKLQKLLLLSFYFFVFEGAVDLTSLLL